MPRPIQPGELHTYEEWLREGYQVQRGQRHVARRDANGVIHHGHSEAQPSLGLPLFAAHQVAPRQAYSAPRPRGTYQPAPRRQRPSERAPAAWLSSHQPLYIQPGTWSSTPVTMQYWPAESTAGRTAARWVVGLELAAAQPEPPEDSQELLQVRREMWDAHVKATGAEQALARMKQRRLVPEDDVRPFQAIVDAEKRVKRQEK